MKRKQKHLLELVRVLRFQSVLPQKYWGECLLTTTYLVNLLPTPVLHNKSPHEVLYNQVPDYSLLKTFGCLCYASLHSDDKFDPRAVQCVFVGYPYLQEGYKVLILDNHYIMVSRHVRFLENIFPYHSHNNSSVPYTTTTPCNSYTFLNWLSHGSSSITLYDKTCSPLTEGLPSTHSHPEESVSVDPPSTESIPDLHDSTDVSHSVDSSSLIRQSTRSKSRPA